MASPLRTSPRSGRSGPETMARPESAVSACRWSDPWQTGCGSYGTTNTARRSGRRSGSTTNHRRTRWMRSASTKVSARRGSRKSANRQTVRKVCEENPMTLVVGVSFKKLGPLYEFLATDFPDLKRHDAVIVSVGDKPSDIRFATVEHAPREVAAGEIFKNPLRPVLRRASPEDFARRERLEARQAEAHRLGLAKIAAHGLSMKLIETECAEDGRRLTYHFVAEGRIDFRELVKDLAEEMHTHVMMHQVGPRDHARMIPSYGPCGRPTCCSTFLREFEQITVRMAKDQDLALNPGTYSGLDR